MCFVTHQLGTTRHPRDGMYHQIQATLRNNSSDAGTVWQVAKIAWIWRTPRSKSFRKSLGLMVLGIVHVSLFSAAGLLSFRLTTVQDEVLVRSPNCGPWSIGPAVPSVLTELVEYNVHRTANSELTKQYVRDCLNTSQTSTECSAFKSNMLNYTTTRNAPCPFPDGMCLGLPDNAATFDTGLIDSCHDLGINAEMKDRVQFRKTMTCSPLTTEGFLQNGTFIHSHDGQNYSYTSLSYGARNDSSSPNSYVLPDDVPLGNATFLLLDSSISLLPYIKEPAHASSYTFR